MKLSDEELPQALKQFSSKNNSGMVNYVDFLKHFSENSISKDKKSQDWENLKSPVMRQVILKLREKFTFRKNESSDSVSFLI